MGYEETVDFNRPTGPFAFPTVPIDSLPTGTQDSRLKKICKTVVGGAIIFTIGFFFCRLAWPRYVEVEKVVEVEKIVERPQIITLPAAKSKAQNQRDIDAEIRAGAKAKMYTLVQSSWKGVLQVKDGEAQTIWRNRAALGNKLGFADLKNDYYLVYNYFTYLGIGYGFVEDSQENFFLLVWYPGATKAPLTNPGVLKLVKGRLIEAGGL